MNEDTREQAVRRSFSAGWVPRRPETSTRSGLLAPDYSYTHASNGSFDDRATCLNIFRPESPTYRRYPKYEVSVLLFRFYPSVAIVLPRLPGNRPARQAQRWSSRRRSPEDVAKFQGALEELASLPRV